MPIELQVRDDAYDDTATLERVRSDNPLPVKDAGQRVDFSEARNQPLLPTWLSTNITSQTTTVVKRGAGILHGLVINTPLAAGTIALYDGLSTSGTLIGTITYPATLLNDQPTEVTYDRLCSGGITIVTGSANLNITVLYR